MALLSKATRQFLISWLEKRDWATWDAEHEGQDHRTHEPSDEAKALATSVHNVQDASSHIGDDATVRATAAATSDLSSMTSTDHARVIDEAMRQGWKPSK